MKVTSKPGGGQPSTSPLCMVFYGDILLVFISLTLAIGCLILPRTPLLLWLPCLLVIVWDLLSLSSLISLNKGIAYRSRSHLLSYILLACMLIILRIFTAMLFAFSLFSPHAITWISIGLIIVTLSHALFGIIASASATSYRNQQLNKRNTVGDVKVEEIAVDTLLSHAVSQNTVFTLIEEQPSV
ncbi:hypothetical protein WR25_03415 [Diploscapter pachys]|uniref:Transmembrane protein n=1 Tax=Diploscapter pachys TaxID=2018661 RepID=A0A2A2LTC3_9BILA|nr:hypothetical protein WR25_03415 [Diploscapter pachys]